MNRMAMSRSLLECGHDEDRDDEVCSSCASERKLQPALYFCFDCGVYGKYLCGKCLTYHNKFIFNHEVENIASQSTSRRFNLKALQQSNDELQSKNKKLKKKNVKLSEELRDCKIDLDRATAELQIRTNECKRVSKRWNENRRLIVKDRDNLKAGLMKKSNKTSAPIIATIDFGTTGTSWAFGNSYELSTIPTKVHTKTWSTDSHSLMTNKASTSVLIHPDGKTFYSFGYEAEDMYAHLVEKNKHTKWFFFKHFNMNYDDRLGIVRNIMFEDVTGKQLEAKTVYALSIRYLKDDLMQLLNNRCSVAIDEDDIYWAFTVPAISNDAAKQFMTDAILEAGIRENLLAIAPEPVAVSLLSRNLPINETFGRCKESFANLQAEGKYMIVDVGGETIQITVLELLSDGDFRELYAECDVGMGGNKVDEAYEAFLIEIFGTDVITEFKTNNQEDYIDMRREFESKKMRLNLQIENVSLKIPQSFCDIVKDTVRSSVTECIALSKYKNEFVFTCDKARIKSFVLKRFFDIPLRCIFDNIKAVFAEPQVSGCSTILMVGGFAESPILQNYIRQQLPDKNIIIPSEAGLAVIKGAIIFGHTTSYCTQ